MPQTGTVLIKLWAVVGPDESLGNESNKGCRLSENQILARVQSLQRNASIFGTRVQFQATTVATIEWNRLLPFLPRTQDDAFFEQDILENHFVSGRINVFFVGNVQVDADPYGRAAWGVDPRDAFFISPYILINDGGFDRTSGFASHWSPDEVLSYFVFEHEVAHFLARFINTAFGPPEARREYGSDEHVPNEPPTNNNLLRAGIVPPAHKLVIPGRFADEQTEAGLIWKRIRDGTWMSP